MLSRLDNFPIVCALRIAAIVILVVWVLQILNQTILPYFTSVSLYSEPQTIFMGVQLVLMQIPHFLSQPLILLGLAEIINLMRNKNDQN